VPTSRRPVGVSRISQATAAARRHRRLIATLLAACAVYAAVSELRPEPPATASVVVASRDLPPGSTIGADDIRVTAWPANGLPPDSMTDVSAIVGRSLAVPVRERTPVLAPMLVGPDALAASSRASIAVPVRLSDPGAAILLASGDLVDVWATSDTGPRVATRVAASARVVAVPRPSSGTASLGAGGGSGGLVVLAVPEGTVPGLAYAAATARLTVALLPR
jgi:hypothetical protein